MQHKKELSHGKRAQKKPWGLEDLDPLVTLKKIKTERAYMDEWTNNCIIKLKKKRKWLNNAGTRLNYILLFFKVDTAEHSWVKNFPSKGYTQLREEIRVSGEKILDRRVLTSPASSVLWERVCS